MTTPENIITMLPKPSVTHHHYKTVNSTQIKAREFINQLEPNHWYLITADAQTAGKGTHGRTWFSPENDNIYATFAFPVSKNQFHLLSNIPQVVAYAILLTLEHFGLKPKLKWINDILVNKKKIAGILCQSEPSASQIYSEAHFVVLAGIGINVNMTFEHCSSIDQPVTSMQLEADHYMDRMEVLNILQTYFTSSIQTLFLSGFAAFERVISEKLEYIGETIHLQEDHSKKITTGILIGVDSKGYLRLNTGKSVKTFLSGRILTENQRTQTVLSSKN